MLGVQALERTKSLQIVEMSYFVKCLSKVGWKGLIISLSSLHLMDKVPPAVMSPEEINHKNSRGNNCTLFMKYSWLNVQLIFEELSMTIPNPIVITISKISHDKEFNSHFVCNISTIFSK